MGGAILQGLMQGTLMKEKTKTVHYIFTALLILCLISCADRTSGMPKLTDSKVKKNTAPSGAPSTPNPSAPQLDAAVKQKILFERLTDAVMRFEEEIDVSDLAIGCASQPDTTPEYRELYERFAGWLDEQSLFLFHLPLPKSISYTYKSENDNEVSAYKLTYYIKADMAYGDYGRVADAFESYYRAVRKSMSQAEIGYALYRELEKRTVYGENLSSQYQRTACGAVLDGKGVCEDYSIGYKQLMKGVGIEVCCVEGNTRPQPVSEGNVAHMWNKVKLDGKWYNVDATWDDYERAEAEQKAHCEGTYFLKSDHTFYGPFNLNHTLIYDKLLPMVPLASDTKYENPAYVFYDGNTKSDPFYYKGHWYYFSYEDMGIYRSRFDGSDKTRLYQKMYHTNNALKQSNWAKLHRLEFGADKIYFLDYAESHGTNGYALYTMHYDGSAVQKTDAQPSPNEPLRPAGDEPETEEPGIAALRAEIMLSKMKDAYFHGAERYAEPQSAERKSFLTEIKAAEDYVKTAPADEAQAGALYKRLRKARTEYQGLPTRRL